MVPPWALTMPRPLQRAQPGRPDWRARSVRAIRSKTRSARPAPSRCPGRGPRGARSTLAGADLDELVAREYLRALPMRLATRRRSRLASHSPIGGHRA